MKKEKVWRLNIVLNYLVLVLSVIVEGFSLYNYIKFREIDWFNVCLGIVMIFSAILGIKNAKREIYKEEK